MITDNDLAGIDTHGLEVKKGDGEWIVELPDATIYIHRRNHYCDRGRWGFHAYSKAQERFSIDGADGFPRYFFSLQRAFDEMYDWAVFRKQVVHG